MTDKKVVDNCLGRRVTFEKVKAHGANGNLTSKITKNVPIPNGKRIPACKSKGKKK